jgi:hypothetical protein
VIHVLIASMLPLAIFFAVWWKRGRRTTARALVMLAGACLVSGAWAVVPDMPRLWGDLALYVDMHHLSYCNVWWGHCAIDRHDAIDSSMLFPVIFVIAAISVLAVAWRELAQRERTRERTREPGGA